MSVLTNVKAILNITDDTQDALLGVFLNMAKTEILAWTFGKNTTKENIPSWLEPIQVMAVVAAYNQMGAEGETYQTVDGITHSFSSATMIEYIHKNAPSYAELI